AGPFFEAVLRGLPGFPSVEPNNPDARARLIKGFDKLVNLLYEQLRLSAEALVTPLSDPTDWNFVTALFKTITSEAITIAKQHSWGLVPAAPKTDEMLHERAAPIVVPIDQIQPFPSDEDLWRRYAGVGVLIGRADSTVATRPDSNLWWSLSIANLHALN